MSSQQSPIEEFDLYGSFTLSDLHEIAQACRDWYPDSRRTTPSQVAARYALAVEKGIRELEDFLAAAAEAEE